MATPIYFFPRLGRAQLIQGDRLAPGVLAAAGVELAFRDVRSVEHDCAVNEATGRGPGGHSGLFVSILPASREVPARMGWYPDFQRWVCCGPEEASAPLWIGVDREHPPGPADLARTKRVPGEPVELADGQPWLIPVVRSPKRFSLLPCSLDWDDAGVITRRLKQRYHHLWDEMSDAWDLFFGPEGVRGTLAGGLSRALELSIAALAVNYRYGRWEQRVLGLVDDQNWESILEVVADVPFFLAACEAESEKKLPGGRPRDASRWAVYCAWASGRIRGYRPSWGELWLASRGLGCDRPLTVNHVYMVRR